MTLRRVSCFFMRCWYFFLAFSYCTLEDDFPTPKKIHHICKITHHWNRYQHTSLEQVSTHITGTGINTHHWNRYQHTSLEQVSTHITGTGTNTHHWNRYQHTSLEQVSTHITGRGHAVHAYSRTYTPSFRLASMSSANICWRLISWSRTDMHREPI